MKKDNRRHHALSPEELRRLDRWAEDQNVRSEQLLLIAEHELQEINRRLDRQPQFTEIIATYDVESDVDTSLSDHVEERQKDRQTRPPTAPHYLLYLSLPQGTREQLIGDLVEEYQERMLPMFGRRRADFWFWSQAIRSAWVVLPTRVIKFLTFGWLLNWLKQTLSGS